MPTRGPTFIDQENFAQLLAGVQTASGTSYRDVETIYGDMSRLVVAWLAATDAATLRRLYVELGWGGSPNIRAIQAAAQEWMRKHRSNVP